MIIDDYQCYYVYDRDCYVVFYLSKLLIKGKESKFIKNSINYLNYLVDILRKNHVDYFVLSKRQGYSIVESNFFSDNAYKKYYRKGKFVFSRLKEILFIRNKLRCKMLENQDSIKRIKEYISRNGV